MTRFAQCDRDLFGCPQTEKATEVNMQNRTLSSAWTFLAKFIFPVVWITGFGLGTVFLWLGDLHGRNNALPPPQQKFEFLAIWVLGSALILWANAGLKRVRVVEDRLEVSNYLQEISVPFTAITDVKQNRWMNTRPITIHFRDATDFGDRVTFMPKRYFRIAFWSTDPIVDELKKLAGLS